MQKVSTKGCPQEEKHDLYCVKCTFSLMCVTFPKFFTRHLTGLNFLSLSVSENDKNKVVYSISHVCYQYHCYLFVPILLLGVGKETKLLKQIRHWHTSCVDCTRHTCIICTVDSTYCQLEYRNGWVRVNKLTILILITNLLCPPCLWSKSTKGYFHLFSHRPGLDFKFAS